MHQHIDRLQEPQGFQTTHDAIFSIFSFNFSNNIYMFMSSKDWLISLNKCTFSNWVVTILLCTDAHQMFQIHRMLVRRRSCSNCSWSAIQKRGNIDGFVCVICECCLKGSRWWHWEICWAESRLHENQFHLILIIFYYSIPMSLGLINIIIQTSKCTHSRIMGGILWLVESECGVITPQVPLCRKIASSFGALSRRGEISRATWAPIPHCFHATIQMKL